MKNRILGFIGVVWGGGMILYGLFGGRSESEGAYQSGQGMGVIFGLALLVVGLYYLVQSFTTIGVPRNNRSQIRGSVKRR